MNEWMYECSCKIQYACVFVCMCIIVSLSSIKYNQKVQYDTIKTVTYVGADVVGLIVGGFVSPSIVGATVGIAVGYEVGANTLI